MLLLLVLVLVLMISTTRTRTHAHTHPVNVPSLPGEVPSKWKNNVLFRVVFFHSLSVFRFFFALFPFFSLLYKIFILFIPCVCSRKSSDFVFRECVFYRFFFASLTVLFFINYLNAGYALMKCMCWEKNEAGFCPFHSSFILFLPKKTTQNRISYQHIFTTKKK